MILPEIIKYKSPEYEKMLGLRTKILREPLGLIFTDEDLAKDENDFLLVINTNSIQQVSACCILTRIDNQTVKLRQMAVDKALQDSGLGTAMLGFAEFVAESEGFNKIELNARKVAVGFYLKYDYKIEGNEFEEVRIPHFRMTKNLK